MSLVINHNMMAMNAARNLSATYGKLSKSTERLSSGLRINSAADDAAGLAIREMMRSDIAVTKQGLRNAADAISMIQTADGALSVIDEKLIRMKELAEQAATGTYTDLQREIINSEYQAMAAEIDRIANATNFNGIKLLDGSVSNLHGGQGIKIHFGTGNSAAEDYYFVNTGDARATTASGLRVGGDAKNDIWAQGAAAAGAQAGPGCCTAGFSSLNGAVSGAQSGSFAFGYNWDWLEDDDQNLISGKHLAGKWDLASGESLQDLITKVNNGTQSRVAIKFDNSGVTMTEMGTYIGSASGGTYAICLGDEAYYLGCASNLDSQQKAIKLSGTAGSALYIALVTTINTTSASDFWAMWDEKENTVYVFAKEGGDKNNLKACELATAGSTSATLNISSALSTASFINVATGAANNSGTTFSLGGEYWATLSPSLTKTNQGRETWNLTLSGRDVGRERDIWIANFGLAGKDNINVNAANASGLAILGLSAKSVLGLDRDSFIQIQNAADGLWRGAEVRTQSAAQEALEALDAAINKKDVIRANLGALQNRLENTMTNLTIQAENLQSSESRISDVDVATEMTEFTKNNIMAQAATAMLGQANSLAQLALSLIG